MAATGYTPISLYYSTTATNVPVNTDLVNGELAINITDGKLYYKDNTGAVQLLASKAGASGSVTTVSVVSANGLAGTVANATTTPAITLSTTITGLLKGNGTAISAATSGTDYAPATSGTSILYGNGSGGFSNVTIGSGVSFAGGTLSATGSGGTVTSVTGTSPIASSGGTTPAISISQSTTSTDGYLSSTDWNTFNNKVSSQWTTSGSYIYYNTGNVGVGTATPSQKLEVAGTVYSTTGGFKFPDGTTQTTAATAGVTTGKSIALAMIFGF